MRALVILALLLPVAAAAEPLRVFVSVMPLKTFVERIGGARVAVDALVKPGQNPHAYDPSPRQVTALAESRLFVRTGVPFEDVWMGRIRAANPAMEVIDARAGLDLQPLEDHHHDGGHHHHHHDEGIQDPHVWTDPLRVRHMAGNLRDALTRLDPAGAGHYAANHTAFTAELERLHHDIEGLLAGLEDRRFLVYHPAWGYFADRYGLVQMAIESEGKEPGARSLTGIVEQARRHGIGVILVQPQFDHRLAARVAEAIGGRVAVADPLAADYGATLRRVARIIAGLEAR